MLVTFRDVRHAFADLESGKRGRGEIAQWAFGATRAKGAGLLIEPPASADVVWRGLVYLSEADVRSDSGALLHPIEDVLGFRRQLGIISTYHETALGGLTVNERLYVSGLLDLFDRAAGSKDVALVGALLRNVEVDEDSIELTLAQLASREVR